jgi:YegS/Rv2252/BmrU family lipid kinase
VKTAAIVNPHSRNGRTGSEWPRIAEMLARRLGPVETRFTEDHGHGIEIARDLLEHGFERIIAAGGDGTLNEVANGFLRDDQPVNPAAILGVLPLGTGGDFRRSLELPHKLEDAIEVLAAGVPLEIDTGRASFIDREKRPQQRYFVNLLSFGMGGEVAARSRNILSPLGGTVAFLYATVFAFFVYERKQVRLLLDGSPVPHNFEIYNVAVGNGRFHGGGMRACPTAVLNDGIFEVTVIEYLKRWEAMRDLRVLYSENVYQHPKAKHLRASRLVAESDEAVWIEVDGEPLGRLPLEITLLPRRLRVLVPPGSVLLSVRS